MKAHSYAFSESERARDGWSRGHLKLHTDDPELHELRRSYLESSVHEYDVNGGDVDAVQNKVSSKDEDSFTHR